MSLNPIHRFKSVCVLPLTAVWLASAPAQAQPASGMPHSASMPMGQMQKGAAGSQDMKAPKTMGMDGMQKMQMSGDQDKDFAMMMKMHHQKGLEMAEIQIANGKSPEMKGMAKQIVATQKKEIAKFERFLAKQK